MHGRLQIPGAWRGNEELEELLSDIHVCTAGARGLLVSGAVIVAVVVTVHWRLG